MIEYFCKVSKISNIKKIYMIEVYREDKKTIQHVLSLSYTKGDKRPKLVGELQKQFINEANIIIETGLKFYYDNLIYFNIDDTILINN